MARKAVVDAVDAYLTANWTATPFIGPNSPTDRPGGRASFVAVQYPLAMTNTVTIGAPGANVEREEGTIRLVVHINVGDGVAQALTWADDLAALFRNKDIGGVRTFTPTGPAFDDRNEDGGYYKVSVSVPYEHDILA